MKQNTIIGISLMLIALLAIGSATLIAQSSPEAQSVTYNPDCTIKSHESEVIARATEGGTTYLLVDTKSDQDLYTQSIITKDNAGCAQLTAVFEEVGRFGAHVPRSVAISFAKGNWQQAIRIKGKAWLEHQLSTTTVAAQIHSIDIWSEDIAALKSLGVEYPSYFKGIDEFPDRFAAQEYYEQHQADLDPCSGDPDPSSQNHCLPQKEPAL